MPNVLKFFLVLTSLTASGYDSLQIDISNRWTPLNRKSKASLLGDNAYFLRLKKTDKGILKIKSPKEFSIFIDEQLIKNNTYGINWDLDSLKSIYVFPLTISLFTKSSLKKTLTARLALKQETEIGGRTDNGRSSIIIAAFALVWMFMLSFNTNRAVTLEYLSINKFFTLRSMDESLLSQRITSLNNILIYVFCSALIATNLFLLDLSPQFFSGSFPFVNILLLTIVILLILLAKILLIKMLARIFNQSEIAPAQLFNFVKLSLGCFTLSSIYLIAFYLFEMKTSLWGNTVALMFLIVAALYFIVTFLRLIYKGGFTVFHLFSYLCLSEIFPMLLLLKICYF